MDETSLTDFLGESAEGEESDGNVESEESEETAKGDAEDTKATITTYEWTSDGTACESCGETVNRRWRDDEQFVCADCKSW